MLEAGRDVEGEGWDPAPLHPNLMTLIPKEGASCSFHSPTPNTPGRWDNAAGENWITQTPGVAAD